MSDIVFVIATIAEILGFSGILMFVIKRFYKKKDERDEKAHEEDALLRKRVDVGLETIRLLAYSRMSEEIEKLLTKGYATPAERRILDEMYLNYKAHGWNGDMDARLKKVYALRTAHAPGEEVM